MIHAQSFRNASTATRRQQLITHAPPSHQAAIANASDDDIDKLSAGVAAVADAASKPGNPQAAATVAAATVANPIVAAIAHHMVATADWAKWESRDSALNPIGGIDRRKPFPVKLLTGSTAALTTAGAGTLSFAPQEEFEGFRFCVPSGQTAQTATGTLSINQLMVGDRLMQAMAGAMPVDMFSEKTDMGRIDLPIVRLGELITATVAGGTSGATMAAVIFGYARGKNRVLPEGSEVLGERFAPIPTTAVPISGSATITMQPQRHIVLRRIGLDDSQTGFASLSISAINVQDDPQFITGISIPAQLFSELAQDDWLDFDLCQLGGTITIVIANANTSVSVIAQGLCICDLVRLVGDPR